MEFLIFYWKDLALAVTSLVTAASIVVKLTPSPKDDARLAKIVAILDILALNTRNKE